MLVTGVTYRHPGLLAKIVASLDVLSAGRAVLGVGPAWYEREHRGPGVPFPPLAERFERLEETLQICLQMGDPDDVGAYEGRHVRLAETLGQPAPFSRPHRRC
jgi:alkanesulfonate monooxygenase SsuD/methylene tetrahydromethanopterin reductase-like flavin-dependent oxidoreductase (luciferase family)